MQTHAPQATVRPACFSVFGRTATRWPANCLSRRAGAETLHPDQEASVKRLPLCVAAMALAACGPEDSSKEEHEVRGTATVLSACPLGTDGARAPQGVGVWVQKNSVDNDSIYRAGDWFIVHHDVVESGLFEGGVDVFSKLGGKPAYVAFGGRFLKNPPPTSDPSDTPSGANVLYDIDGLRQAGIASLLTAIRTKKPKTNLKGVVIDYEIGDPSQTSAENTLRGIFCRVRSIDSKWAMGITTLARPTSSYGANGVKFSELHKHSDFVLPQLYCQIWGCDPILTERRYCYENRFSSVPVVALLAHRVIRDVDGDDAVGDGVDVGTESTLTASDDGKELTLAALDANYRRLHLRSAAVWNVAQTTEAFWDALRVVVNRADPVEYDASACSTKQEE